MRQLEHVCNKTYFFPMLSRLGKKVVDSDALSVVVSACVRKANRLKTRSNTTHSARYVLQTPRKMGKLL